MVTDPALGADLILDTSGAVSDAIILSMPVTTRSAARPSKTVDRADASTHPWITFRADLRSAGRDLWVAIGEADANIAQVAGAPLLPETAAELHRLYLAKGALATTAIKGNGLTEQQVLQHLQGKLRLAPSQQHWVKEIDNVLVAANQIAQDVRYGAGTLLTPERLRELNRAVLRGLDLEKGVVPGQFRKHSATVADDRGAPAEQCDHLVGRMCEWLNDPALDTGGLTLPPIGSAIVRALLAHLYLTWIHPFGDGNGRTARLLELQILHTAGVPMPAAHLLSSHYNQTRSDYQRLLDATSRSGGDVLAFVLYAVRGLVEGLRSQLAVIRERQSDVAWERYVHGAFKDNNGATADRRRWLALDLAASPIPLPRAAIRDLSPRLARAYANKTDKTLTRDLNALQQLRLVTRDADGYVANRAVTLAFLPATAAAPE